jgi:hypothetical protein
MSNNWSRCIVGGLGAVGLSIGASLATPVVASADPSSDWLLSIDQLLVGVSDPAPAATLDIQISIDGTDLFPTAGNTATATSDAGDIAIAIGNGAQANAFGGLADFAFADGANSVAEAGGSFTEPFPIGTQYLTLPDNSDTALVVGTDSTAIAGGADFAPDSSDLAAAFGNMLAATADLGSGLTDIVP